MADSYRIVQIDQQGPGLIEEKEEEESSKSSPLGNRVIDSSGKSSSGGNNIHTADSDSTSIDLSSNASKLSNDLYKADSSATVDNNKDNFSENSSNSYSNKDIENNKILNSNSNTESYEQIAEIVSNILEARMEDNFDYSNIKSVQENIRDGAEQLVYSIIGEALSSSSSSSSNNNNSNNDNSIDLTSNKSVSSVAMSLNKLNDINTSPLGIADYLIEKINQNITDTNPTDYEDETVTQKDSNSYGNPDYTSDGLSFEFGDYQMSEWETMTYPDAMSNMYDVYFLLRNDNGEEQTFTSGMPIMKALFDGDILSARISSIEIPAYQRQTATINFASNTIERPVDNIDTPGQSSFTIRGDARLYYVSAFNELSGTGIGNFFGKDVISNMKATAIIAQNNQEIESAKEAWEKKQKEINSELEKIIKQEHQETIARVMLYLDSESELTETQKNIKEQIEELQERCKKNSNIDYYTEATTIIDNCVNAADKYKKNVEKENKGAQLNVYSRKEIRKKYKELKKANEAELKAWNALKNAEKENTKKITKELNEKLGEAKKEYKEATKKSNKQRKKAIAGLEFKMVGFDYLVNAMSRNISIVATEIDDTADEEALNSFLKSRKRLDIIVKRTTPNNRFRTILSEKCDERFIFEDVKILGTSNAIQFKRESADTQEFTYNFIYKRFYKQDTYGTTGTWVGSQTKLFTSYVINAISGLFSGKDTGSDYWSQLGKSINKGINVDFFEKSSNAIETDITNISEQIMKPWKP